MSGLDVHISCEPGPKAVYVSAMKPPIHKSSFSLPQSQESLLTGDLRRFRDSMPPLPVLSSFWVWASSLSFDGQKMLLAPKHDTNVSTHSQWWK